MEGKELKIQHWSKVPSYQFDEKEDEYKQVTEYSDVIENRKNMIVSIGNMTLLTSGLNSAIGNSSFGEKILGNGKYDGYKKYVGSLTVAQEIVGVYEQAKQWDERNNVCETKRLWFNISIFLRSTNHWYLSGG